MLTPAHRRAGFTKGQFYTLENVQIDWVGKEELGAIFYHPVDKPPAESDRVKTVEYRVGEGKAIRFATHYRGVSNDTTSPLVT